MVTEEGYSVAEAAKQLGILENCIRNWLKRVKESGEDAFPGHGNKRPGNDEVAKLREEVRKLKAERDLLKKAVAYFANPPS